MNKQSKDILKSMAETLQVIEESCADLTDRVYEAQAEIWQVLDEDDEDQDVD